MFSHNQLQRVNHLIINIYVTHIEIYFHNVHNQESPDNHIVIYFHVINSSIFWVNLYVLKLFQIPPVYIITISPQIKAGEILQNNGCLNH